MMWTAHFPSFSEGLSLRGQEEDNLSVRVKAEFPFLFGGTFIEGYKLTYRHPRAREISLPFRRDFH